MTRASDYDYELPRDLIAQHPLPERDASRLLILDRQKGTIEHTTFRHIINHVSQGDVLVLNNTRVMPVRLVGRTSTGGRVEVLLFFSEDADHWTALLRARGQLKPGERLDLEDGKASVCLLERLPSLAWRLAPERPDAMVALMREHGRAPLPPYIRRPAREDRYGQEDLERYQTVYAEKDGSIAAPTAGLHFTNSLLGDIRAKGVRACFLTLHVGPATFSPVRCGRLEDHVMLPESFEFPQEVADAVLSAKKEKRKVVAVGTTTCRVLETVARYHQFSGCAGRTDLFIKPPFSFRVVDALITNFHLPRSTLLVLVSAFAGRERIMAAYSEAIGTRYRFYSYGDAMLIL